MAIHNSGENGIRNASSGMSVLIFGAANNDTPLWKYGALKSITSARDLLAKIDLFNLVRNRIEQEAKSDIYFDTLSGAKDISAEPTTKSPTMPFHAD